MARTTTARRATAATRAGARPRPDGLARARRWALFAVLVAVPAAVDTGAADKFSTVKFSALLVGASVLAALTALHALARRRPPLWRTPAHLLVAGLLAWTAVATAAGVNPGFSVWGAYASYDGLVAAVVFAVLFVATADAVRAADLRTFATVVYLGAGTPVVGYGLVQLHDRLTSWGGTWDWADWGRPPNPDWIWSTFGNPNHLAAFCAVLLPIGLILLAVHRAAWVRALVAAVAGAATLQLVYVQSRGAWFGAIAGVAAVGVLLARDLLRHRRVLALAAAGLLVVALVGGMAVGLGSVGRQFASSFDPGGRTTVERTEYWRAAWRMAADRPLVGVGPDAYRLEFHRRQSDRFVEEFGPTRLPNGPHNVFFAHLAHGGVPQLLLFLALLGVVGRGAVRTARRLRAEEDEQRHPGPRRQAFEARLAFAGLTAATVAFVVQAAFNTQEVDLNFWLWVLLGALVGAEAAGNGAAPAGRGGLRGTGVRVVAAAVVAVALVAAWAGTAPYRADRASADARRQGSLAVAYARSGALDQAQVEAARADRLYADVVGLAPRPTEYRIADAGWNFSLARVAWEAGSRDVALARFERARQRYREATEAQPQNALLLAEYARLLTRITEVTGGELDHSDEAEAVERRARRANPFAEGRAED